MTTKYNAPIILRPSDADQEIIDRIARDLRTCGHTPTSSAILRQALQAWDRLDVSGDTKHLKFLDEALNSGDGTYKP